MPDPEEVEEVCEVHPAHVDALHLFMACQSQWQLSIGMSAGHWAAAQSVNVEQEARWMGLQRARRALVVRQYRQMECEAMQILNEREARKS